MRRTVVAPGASLAVLLAAVVAVPASAVGGRYDLPGLFRTQIAHIKQKSDAPVLLPHYLVALPHVRAYASGSASRNHWHLALEADPSCHGANACFLASFDARRSGSLPARPNLRLATGEPALYVPFSCGASCGPTSLWFRHDGVLYSWQSKLTAKKAVLTRLAAEAIRTGPR